MNNALDKQSAVSGIVLQSPSSIPSGLQITQEARLRTAQAETFARFHLALVLPRNMLDVSTKLLAACDNPDFAKTAFYRKPGSPPVEGLSVRFAELAHQLMRNISIDCSPEMEDEFSVHYRMTITDLESNTPTSETFRVNKTVERRSCKEGDSVLGQRTNSTGETVYLLPATEDQMTTKVNAQKSKVKRTLILALVPAEVRAQCLTKCKEIAGSSDKKDPASAVKGIVTSFLSIGIDVPDLKEYLGKSPQAAVEKDIEELRGIYAMLRDGELTWADVIEAKRERDAAKGSKTAFVDAKLKERADKKKKKAADAAKAASGPAAGAERAQRQPRAQAEPPAEAAAADKSKGGAATKPPKEDPAPPRARASRRGGETQETDGGTGDDAPPSSDSPPDSSS